MNTVMTVDIEDNSKVLLSEVEKIAKLALDSIGETAEGYAKEDCPVDTGNLRNSIAHMTDDTEGSMAVYIGTNVVYAPVQEFKDLRHTSGKSHFLRDAIAQHGDEYGQIVSAVYKANLP